MGAVKPSKYHYAAHFGQLIQGYEGQGCHNMYPMCPFSGEDVQQIARKIPLKWNEKSLVFLYGNSKIHSEYNTLAQCLKIAQKVTFNIASEASYFYILSGKKYIKNAKNGPFWRVFESLKLAVKQCYQDRTVLIGQKLVEML